MAKTSTPVTPTPVTPAKKLPQWIPGTPQGVIDEYNKQQDAQNNTKPAQYPDGPVNVADVRANKTQFSANTPDFVVNAWNSLIASGYKPLQAAKQATSNWYANDPESMIVRNKFIEGFHMLPVGFNYSLDQINQQIGYTPTYWENPQRIARMYQASAGIPSTFDIPWLDRPMIKALNDYYTQQNNNKPWWEWSTVVATDDPARTFLQQMQLPPPSFMTPSDQQDFKDASTAFYKASDDQQKQLEMYNQLDAQAREQGKTIEQVAQEYVDKQTPNEFGFLPDVWKAMPIWQQAIVRVTPMVSAIPFVLGGATASAGAGALAGSVVPGAGTAVGAVVGGIAGAFGGYKVSQLVTNEYQKANEEGKQNLLTFVMNAIQVPSQVTEQALGTYAYILDKAVDNPNQNAYQVLAPIVRDLPNVWNANRMYYETLFTGSKKTVLGTPEQVPTQPVEGQGAKSERYIAEIVKRLDNGESLNTIETDIRSQVGYFGQARDMISQMFLNPMNYIGKITAKGVSTIANVAGNELLSAAFDGATGPVEGLKRYSILLNTEMPTEQLSQMGAFTRWIADVDKNGVKNYLAQPDSKIPFYDPRRLFGLTDESRANLAIKDFATNLAVVINNKNLTPSEMVDIITQIASQDPENIANLALDHPWLKTPEGAVVVKMLQDYDAGGKLLEIYRLTRPQADYVGHAADILGISTDDLLKRIHDDGYDTVWTSISKAIDAAPDNDPTAGYLARSMGSDGTAMNADEFGKITSVFTKGTTPAPIDTRMFRYQFTASLIDQANDWSVKWFNIKPDPWAIRLSDMMKSAQAFLYLGLNPEYVLNVGLNQMVTMAWDGVLGFQSQSAITDWWNSNFGGEPPTLRERMDITAEGEPMQMNAGVRAAKVVPGPERTPIDTVQSLLRSRGADKLRIAQNMVRDIYANNSAQAFTTGTMKAMAQLIQPDVGFDALPQDMEMALVQADINPNTIYAALKGGADPKMIQSILGTQVIRTTLDSAIPEVVDGLNKMGILVKVGDVESSLREAGIYDDLKTKLDAAENVDDVHKIFKDTRDVLSDKLTKIITDNTGDLIERATQRVVGEGGQAVFDVLDDVSMVRHDADIQSDRDWERVMSSAQYMDKDSRDALVTSQIEATRARYNQLNEITRAKMYGLAQALDATDPQVASILAGNAKLTKIWNDYTDLRLNKLDEFFNSGLRGDERIAKWQEVSSILLDEYKKALDAERGVRTETSDVLVQMVSKEFPGMEGAIQQWRDGYDNMAKTEGDMMVNARTDVQAINDPIARAKFWQEFHDDYTKKMNDAYAENRGLAKAAFGASNISAKPRYTFRSVNDTQSMLAVHGIYSWDQWRDLVPELNMHLPDGSPAFNDVDYLVTPTAEWWARARTAIHDWDRTPAQVSRYTKFITTGGIDIIPTFEVRAKLRTALLAAGVREDGVDATLALADARAAVWAFDNISTSDEWYGTHIGGLVVKKPGEEIQGQLVLNQTMNSAPYFYSKITKLIDAFPQEKATVAQWRGTIDKMTKVDERNYTGWADVFDGAKDSDIFTKTQVRDYINKKNIKVRVDIDQQLGSGAVIGANAPSVTPGPADLSYQEYLLPSSSKLGDSEINRANILVFSDDPNANQISSPHWGNADGSATGLVGHARTSTHFDAAGNKLLVVEELQSDMLQSAEKRVGNISNNWKEVVLKSALRFASDNGYDGVVVAPAADPVSMYGTDAVRWTKNDTYVTLGMFPNLDNAGYIPNLDALNQVIKSGFNESGNYGDYVNTVQVKLADINSQSTRNKLVELFKQTMFRSKDAEKFVDKILNKVNSTNDEGYFLPYQSSMEESYNNINPGVLADYVKKTGSKLGLQDVNFNDSPLKVMLGSEIPIKYLGERSIDLLDEIGPKDVDPNKFYIVNQSGEPGASVSLVDKWGIPFDNAEDANNYLAAHYTGKGVYFDENAKAALSAPQPLWQRSGELVKGATSFDLNTGQAVINLIEGASDFTTLVHELGHVFRQDLPEAQIYAIQKWLGETGGETPNYNFATGQWMRDGRVVNGQPIDVWAEEKFASAWERWLREGGPRKGADLTPEMQKVFSSVKSWMTAYYKTIKGSDIDVKMNDNIRGVFENMLGTEPSREQGSVGATPDMKSAANNMIANEVMQGKTVGSWPAPKEPMLTHVIDTGPYKGRVGWYYDGALIAWVPMDEFHGTEWMQGESNMFRVLGESTSKQGTWLIENEDHTLSWIKGDSTAQIEEKSLNAIKAGKASAATRAAKQAVMVKAPVGAVEEALNTPPLTEVKVEGVQNNLPQILDGLENHFTDNFESTQNPAGMSDQLRTDVSNYARKAVGQIESAKLTAVKMGESRRNFALVDYMRKYGFDSFVQSVFPYEFFYTRSMMNWMMRMVNNPGILSNYIRLRSYGMAFANQNFPSRLTNKIALPFPFLPAGSGNNIYVDPLSRVFPFEQFASPITQQAQTNKQIEYQTKSDIQDQIDSGTLPKVDGEAAITNMSGVIWDKAYKNASDVVNQDTNPLDFFSILSSPSIFLTSAVNAAMGKRTDIGQLPIVKMVQAISGLLKLGPPGGVNLTQGLYNTLGQPPVDSFQDFRIDRELANMTANGLITSDQAITAMIDRKGQAFDQANTQVGAQRGWQYVMQSLAADLYPEGEQKQRNIKSIFSNVFGNVSEFNSSAYQKFVTMFPEYAARVAAMKDPQTRLDTFLRAIVWDNYYKLNTLEQKKVREVLGAEFSEKFINKDTRNYDSINTQTLTMWANALGGVLPESVPAAPQMSIQMPDKTESTTLESFYAQKANLFPNVTESSNVYYSTLGSNAAFSDVIAESKKYTVWENQFLAQNPTIIPDVIGAGNSLYGLPNSVQAKVYQYRAARDQLFPNIFDIQNKYFSYYDAGNRRGAYSYLQKHSELLGYWDFRKQMASTNPDASPYILGEESLSSYIDKKYTPGQTLTPINANMLGPLLVSNLSGYFYAGEALSVGASATLNTLWDNLGQPYNNFEAWLDLDVRPAIAQ